MGNVYELDKAGMPVLFNAEPMGAVALAGTAQTLDPRHRLTAIPSVALIERMMGPHTAVVSPFIARPDVRTMT